MERIKTVSAKMFRGALAGLILCLMPQVLSGQPRLADRVEFVGNHHFPQKTLKALLGLRVDSLALPERLNHLLIFYQKSGFLEARIDSVQETANSDSNYLRIFLSEGRQFRVGRIIWLGDVVSPEESVKSNFDIEPGQPFNQEQIDVEMRQLLEHLGRLGYLLAKVELLKADIDYDSARVNLVFRMSPGKRVALEKVEIQGGSSISPALVARYAGLQVNGILSMTKFHQIAERLKRVSFLQLTGKPELRFTADSSAVVVLPLKEQNSSQLNGVVGYNPGDGRQNGYLTGQLDLQFRNLFGTGRELTTFWEKQNPYTQTLQIQYREPFLGGLPVDGRFGFGQVIQDSSFIRREWHLGLQTNLIENIFVTAEVGQERVIPDSAGRRLYNLGSARADRLFLAVSLDSRDHPWNPLSGLFYTTSVDFVRKRRTEAPDTTTAQQNVQRLRLDFEGFLPLFSKQVLRVALSGRLVKIGAEVIPVDELYRLGGANDLRGYREDQFVGDRVAWGSLEWRLVPDRSTMFHAFLDFGYISRTFKSNQRKELFRLGYGLGMRTRTNLGIVGFDFALGQGESFSQGKIHVRLINRF